MKTGERVKAARTEKGWSQLELSLQADVGQSTICKIERGQMDVSPANAQKLAEALDIPVMELLDDA